MDQLVAMGSCICTGCDRADTGETFVTTQEFAEKLEKEVSKPSAKKGEVMINLDVIETILMEGDGTVPKADEKYISEQEVEKAIVRVNSKELPKGRSSSSARKGTGYITKAQMMDILSKVDDEEEEEELQSTAAKESGRRTSTSSRCKDRKGTGFVSKDKLQKILAAAGEEETQ